MRIRLVIVFLTAAAVAGCGSTVKTRTVTRTVTNTITNTVTVNGPTKTVAVKAPPKPPPSHKGALTIQDFNGNTLLVAPTLIDPATPDSSFDDPPAGTRLVAIRLKLTSQGPGAISDDANNDATVIGSNDQDYNASFDSIAGCTNFNSGDYTIPKGQSQTGCVAYEVPTGVKVKSLQFSLGGNTIEFSG